MKHAERFDLKKLSLITVIRFFNLYEKRKKIACNN
jgi:hypothetical protein